MALPYFYVPDISATQVIMDEDTSKHMIQVLRMERSEELLLTNGKGTIARGVITDDHRKRCIVQVTATENKEPLRPFITIGISLIKNAARFEWFLEKATEIGVNEIIPMVCDRTEKEKFRRDRLNNILISAMLQSQQPWLPVLQEPIIFEQLVKQNKSEEKLIAHCIPEQKVSLYEVPAQKSQIILIGPEGDFTPEEIDMALHCQFKPVTLGETRLRTETAGMVAAAVLRNQKM